MGGTDDKEQGENSGDAEYVHYPDCGFLDVNTCQKSLKLCVLKMYSLLYISVPQYYTKKGKCDRLNDHFHLFNDKIQRHISSETSVLWQEIIHYSRQRGQCSHTLLMGLSFSSCVHLFALVWRNLLYTLYMESESSTL